jgi:hypothetical protein
MYNPPNVVRAPSRGSGLSTAVVVLFILMASGTVAAVGCGAVVYVIARREKTTRSADGGLDLGVAGAGAPASSGEGDDEDEDEGEPHSADVGKAPKDPVAIPEPTRGNQKRVSYVCTAFASFRACGFAGVCGPRSASAVGTADSEPAARAMALSSCRSSAAAQGAQGVPFCSVTACRAQ